MYVSMCAHIHFLLSFIYIVLYILVSRCRIPVSYLLRIAMSCVRVVHVSRVHASYLCPVPMLFMYLCMHICTSSYQLYIYSIYSRVMLSCPRVLLFTNCHVVCLCYACPCPCFLVDYQNMKVKTSLIY